MTMDTLHVHDVPMTDVELGGINVRTDLDTPNSQEALQELAESIKENGLMQPVMLRGEYGKPPYDVVAGHRRFKAHELLNATSIRAVFSGEIDDRKALLLSLSENICRQELNYSDIANAVTKLYNEFGKDDRVVSQHLGISLKKVRNYIKLEEQATAKIRAMLKDGFSPVDARRALDAAQGDPALADALVDEIAKLTKYEKSRLVEVGRRERITNVGDAIAEARKPKLEDTIILTLPLKVHDALSRAAEDLSLEPEELTKNALMSWLRTNDYLLEESA